MIRFAFWEILFLFPVLLFLSLLLKQKITNEKRKNNKGVVFTGPFEKTPTVSTGKFFTTFLPWLGLLFLIIALARPQSGFERLPDAGEGVDIVIALDGLGGYVEVSMDLGSFTPALNMGFTQDGYVADDDFGFIMLGAAEPITICPPTFDHNTLKRFIENAELGFLEDGTAIGSGLATAARGLGASSTNRRVIVLLS